MSRNAMPGLGKSGMVRISGRIAALNASVSNLRLSFSTTVTVPLRRSDPPPPPKPPPEETPTCTNTRSTSGWSSMMRVTWPETRSMSLRLEPGGPWIDR